jgi:primosomal protein N' (replication factor Y) (superfamily II helicase)
MTVHQSDRSLRCHHCDARRTIPAECASCGKSALFSQGLGTQRLEATVRSLLPDARIARLDRDATEQRGLLVETLTAWRKGEVDVLLGTQMIAKGHDVPGVTLVGVVQADVSLAVPDFRGTERTFQLLSQVAGRAGRGTEQGRVLVQTYQPEHPAIAHAARHDFDGFARIELAERAELGYPPLTRMGMLRFEGAERSVVERIAAQAARAMVESATHESDLAVRGPAPALIERIKERYRFHVHVRSVRSGAVRHALSQGRAAAASAARVSRVRVLVDVDPVDMF